LSTKVSTISSITSAFGALDDEAAAAEEEEGEGEGPGADADEAALPGRSVDDAADAGIAGEAAAAAEAAPAEAAADIVRESAGKESVRGEASDKGQVRGRMIILSMWTIVLYAAVCPARIVQCARTRRRALCPTGRKGRDREAIDVHITLHDAQKRNRRR